MSVMKYSLLVKDLAAHDKIERLQKIKRILGAVLYVTIFVNLIFLFADEMFIGEIIFLIAALIYAGFYIFFHAVLSGTRKNQMIDPSNTVDAAIISLNAKYDKFLKKRRRKWLFLGLFFLVAVIGIVIVGLLAQEEDIYLWAGLTALLIILPICAVSISDTMFQFKFAADCMTEIDLLTTHFYKAKGLTDEQIKKKKRNIFNSADNQKIMTYMYPDEKIRGKLRRAAMFYIIPAIIGGGIFGATMPSAVESGDYTAMYISGIIMVVLMALCIVWMTLYQKKLQEQQRILFEKEPEKYKYHLELFAETKAYQKQSNKIFGISSLFILIACVVICLFGGIEALPVAIIAGVLAVFAVSLVLLFVLYPKYRKRAKPIEFQIDEHLKSLEVAAAPFSDILNEQQGSAE